MTERRGGVAFLFLVASVLSTMNSLWLGAFFAKPSATVSFALALLGPWLSVVTTVTWLRAAWSAPKDRLSRQWIAVLVPLSMLVGMVITWEIAISWNFIALPVFLSAVLPVTALTFAALRRTLGAARASSRDE